jgi:hypothetical protein
MPLPRCQTVAASAPPPTGSYRPPNPPPQGYAPPAPNYGGQPYPQGYDQRPNEPSAVTALVLGILGIAVCGVVAPFAWSTGKKSLDAIRASQGRWGGEGMAQAGYIMGIIGTALLALGVLFFIVYFVIMGAMIANAS